MTLATAAIPTKAQRQATHLGWLRDPAREQPVIDFYRYNSDLVADTIGYFAKAVKDLTRREKIVGVFYGYVLQLCGEQRQQNAGHLAPGAGARLARRGLPVQPDELRLPAARRRGHEPFHVAAGQRPSCTASCGSTRTTSAPRCPAGRSASGADPPTSRAICLQQDKELANCLVHGAAQWWFDVGGNRYNHPELMKRIGELTAKADQVLPRDRSARRRSRLRRR